MQQFAVLSTAIAAFALGCNGAVLGSRDFIKAEFRLYSGTDCFAGNLGFVEAFNETLGVCGTFSDQVYSVNVLVADNGCTGKWQLHTHTHTHPSHPSRPHRVPAAPAVHAPTGGKSAPRTPTQLLTQV